MENDIRYANATRISLPKINAAHKPNEDLRESLNDIESKYIGSPSFDSED